MSNVRHTGLKADLMPCLPSPATECFELDAVCQCESRACFSVGVGCPSFGGQRTVRGGVGRLLARVVTKPMASLFGKLRGQAFSKFGPKRYFARISRTHSLQRVATLPKASATARPSPKRQMLEVPTRQRRASWLSSQASSPVVLSRSGQLAVRPDPPNPSVKGTSRKRAAPYVER